MVGDEKEKKKNCKNVADGKHAHQTPHLVLNELTFLLHDNLNIVTKREGVRCFERDETNRQAARQAGYQDQGFSHSHNINKTTRNE